MFKLKGGQKEYKNFYEAVTVAEAKAADEAEPVIICRRRTHMFEDVVKVLPNGSQELLDDSFSP